MELTRHPLSHELFSELLNRPSPTIQGSAIVIQWALVPQPGAKDPTAAARMAIERLCQAFGVQGPAAGKHHHVDLGPAELRWEQHTEFSSVVLIAKDQDTVDQMPKDWTELLVHQLLTGAVITVDTTANAFERSIQDQRNVVGGVVLDGQAELATSLQPNADGLVHYHILNKGLDGARMGRLVQRIYEMETYRMLSLLGLPVAKQASETLNSLESQLVSLVERLGNTQDLSDDQRLLDELFGLARTSEQLFADTDYRFSATQAYGRIVTDRIDELREQAVEGRQALGEFLERRFEPALRTCAHISKRQQNLSERIARTVSLARTRVEVTLQTQHRTQLEAMARRAQLQLRLQRTVEGLSVMAISYYTIGILAYLLGGWMPKGQLNLLISITSPILLIGIWWTLKRWRQALMRDDSEP